jgi:hypothetical protein
MPFLETEPAPVYELLRTSDVMATPVKTLPMHVPVRQVTDLLTYSTHNGFPVHEDTEPRHFRGYALIADRPIVGFSMLFTELDDWW